LHCPLWAISIPKAKQDKYLEETCEWLAKPWVDLAQMEKLVGSHHSLIAHRLWQMAYHTWPGSYPFKHLSLVSTVHVSNLISCQCRLAQVYNGG
jgi:hypothetical protein